MRLTVTIAICLIAALTGAIRAQTAQGPADPAQDVSATPMPALVSLSGYSSDYQVGPGDLLEIQVVGHADLMQRLRLSNAGEISHSLVGILKVEDKTAFEIEELIAARLTELGLMRQAQVLVSIQEYQAKPVYVTGAVLNPGEFIMSQELTVTDAVLMAGGLRFNASSEAFLHRKLTGTETANWTIESLTENPSVARPGGEVIRVDLQPLKEGQFQADALPLRRGDVLVVPLLQMNAFYVMGEVRVPSNYTYNPRQAMTASQAISWAGGPTRTARMSSGILVRYTADGTRTERKVDYQAILERRQPDFPIQSNDIIFIPGSKIKTLGQGLLGLTDSMVMSASFRAARTYQLPDAPERLSGPQP